MDAVGLLIVGAEILVADDYQPVRREIRLVLRRRKDWHVCAEAADGIQAVEATRRFCPDVALIDVQMPHLNGLEAARQIIAICPRTLILIESFHDVGSYVAQLRDIWIRGFVQKDRIDTDLIPAIESALNSGGYVHFAKA